MENLPERKPLFDTFDWLIGIGAVPFQSPPIYVAAALLVIARHWSLPARGFFVLARDVFGAREVTPLWCKVFPGLEGYLVTPPVEPPKADEQTDRADRPSVSVDDLHVERLQLDKTKVAVIEVLVYNGWGTGEIRSMLKGDNGVTGTEVEAARKRLGIDPPERTMKVKDEKGERVISY